VACHDARVADAGHATPATGARIAGRLSLSTVWRAGPEGRLRAADQKTAASARS
jgi:hypothetical protein